MSDLYNILLKNTENISFGADPISIIMPKSKGDVVGTKKLLVTYDGEEQEPINCQSIIVKYEDDTIMLNIILVKENEESSVSPQAEAVIPPSKTDTFALQGDDLESLELLSDFRKKENQVQKFEKGEAKYEHIIESGMFDIQDLTSIESAIFDIITKEKQLIDKGYKVFKPTPPVFKYEDSNVFKLVESVSLIKQATNIVEKKNSK